MVRQDEADTHSTFMRLDFLAILPEARLNFHLIQQLGDARLLHENYLQFAKGAGTGLSTVSPPLGLKGSI